MFTQIRRLAAKAVQELAKVQTKQVKADNGGIFMVVSAAGKKRLRKMGLTKILSKSYDPKFKITFHVGLVDLIKTQMMASPMTPSLERPSLNYTLQQLILASKEGMEKPMIIRMVEMAELLVQNKNNKKTDPVLNQQEAKGTIGGVLENSLVHIHPPNKEPTPDDDQFAIAIKAGLIETLLKVLTRFQKQSSVVACIGDLLKCASAVALLKKSLQVVKGKQDDILQAVQVASTSSTTGRVQEFIGVARSIVELNTSGEQMKEANVVFCRRCLKGLSKEETK